MEFELSDQQSAVISSVRTLLARHAGAERARALGGDAPAYDTALEEALEAAGFGAIGEDPDGGPLDAALLLEEVSRELGVVAYGSRALVAVGLGLADLPRPITLAVAGRAGPTRFAADAATLVVLDADEVWIGRVEPGTYPSVASRFGYPFGDFDGSVPAGEPVARAAAARALAWWRLSLSTEMVGTMGAALELTIGYVTDRKQFGRAIGSFQVIQHRLAELTVLVEGARYLALEAAWRGAPAEAASVALAHASSVARRLPGELHQMTGAIGFATEYPLHLWTMRLPALLAEARGLPSAEHDLVALRWPGSTL